jgi:hypothetical protein
MRDLRRRLGRIADSPGSRDLWWLHSREAVLTSLRWMTRRCYTLKDKERKTKTLSISLRDGPSIKETSGIECIDSFVIGLFPQSSIGTIDFGPFVTLFVYIAVSHLSC